MKGSERPIPTDPGHTSPDPGQVPVEPGADLEDLVRAVIDESTAHNQSLGLRFGSLQRRELRATVLLPYSERLVADPDSGSIHPGALTALIDVACGGAVCAQLGRIQRIATLDLRIDCVRPPAKGRAIVAQAECLKVNAGVAYVRAIAHDGDAADIVALAQGTFVLQEG
jgi:uncharacterized protein (TIGR00369 family)